MRLIEYPWGSHVTCPSIFSMKWGWKWRDRFLERRGHSPLNVEVAAAKKCTTQKNPKALAPRLFTTKMHVGLKATTSQASVALTVPVSPRHDLVTKASRKCPKNVKETFWGDRTKKDGKGHFILLDIKKIKLEVILLLFFVGNITYATFLFWPFFRSKFEGHQSSLSEVLKNHCLLSKSLLSGKHKKEREYYNILNNCNTHKVAAIFGSGIRVL